MGDVAWTCALYLISSFSIFSRCGSTWKIHSITIDDAVSVSTCCTLSRTPDVSSPRTSVLSTALTARWVNRWWWGQELELLCQWNVHQRWPRSLRIFPEAWTHSPQALNDLCQINLLAVLTARLTDNYTVHNLTLYGQELLSLIQSTSHYIAGNDWN